MKKEYLCIDLGSNQTRIYSSKDDGLLFNEPTCIALETGKNKVKDIGLLAEQIEGKAPLSYQVIRPVKNGQIIDDDACFTFLSTILKKIGYTRKNTSQYLMFALPSMSGKVNRKIVVEIAKKLEAKEVYIESEAKLAALGSGDAVFSPTATLVCDIGAGVSDIVLLSLGEIVSAETTSIAGNTFDEAIRRYMIQKQHLDIGLKSAEYIKRRVGSLYPSGESQLVEIKGKDTITSLPSSVIVSAGEIRSALIPLAEYIALKITDVISKAPAELVADLKKKGLILTGGGALMAGIKEFLQDKLSLPVTIASKPDMAVIDGFKNYIEHISKEGE